MRSCRSHLERTAVVETQRRGMAADEAWRTGVERFRGGQREVRETVRVREGPGVRGEYLRRTWDTPLRMLEDESGFAAIRDRIAGAGLGREHTAIVLDCEQVLLDQAERGPRSGELRLFAWSRSGRAWFIVVG